MISEVILHLGMEKTGSSSIQRSFGDYDDGNLIYAPVEWINHSAPVQLFFRPSDQRSPGIQAQNLSDAEYEGRRERAGKQLREVMELDRERLLISAEGALALTGPQHCDMRDFFSANGEKLRLLAYVRDPISYASSAYQQGLKTGNIKFRIPQQRFKMRISRVFEAYGEDKLELIPFDSKSFPSGSVVQDFADRIGAKSDLITESRSNESMSMFAAACLFLWSKEGVKSDGSPIRFAARNQVIRNLIDNKPNIRHWIAHKLLNPVDPAVMERGAKKFRFSEALVRDNVDLEDVAWMEEKLGAPLLKDPKPGAADSDHGVRSEDDFVEIAQNANEWLKPLLKRFKLGSNHLTTVASLNVLYEYHLERMKNKELTEN